MFHKVQKKLVITYTTTYGLALLVLLFFLGFVLISQKQESYQNDLRTDFSREMLRFEKEKTIKDSFLASEELEKNYVIFVLDHDEEIQFQGRYLIGKNRTLLFEKCKQNEIGSERVSVIKSEGSSYYVLKNNILDERVTLFYCLDTKMMEREIRGLKMFLVLFFIFGLILIYLISRVLAKNAIEPLVISQKKQIEFVQAASHELRSPLAVIRASVSALQLKEETVSYYPKVIIHECERLGRLVDDLLLLGTAESKKWTVTMKEVNLDTVLIQCYENYEAICAKEGMAMQLDLPEESLKSAKGDEQRIAQVIDILIDNAISYAKSDKGIRLRAYERKKHLYIELIDYGIGISKEHKEAIFERFYRGDNSRKDKEHFGLGLCIAKELIHLQNGQLSVKDTEGGGTTFVIRLEKW